MGSWSNKVVVVTGGSTGIGRGVAERFAREGAKVAIIARDPKKLANAEKQIKPALAFQGDVSKVADLERFYAEVKKIGPIDLLVANAGVGEMKPLKEVDEAFFDWMVGINYKGVFFTVQRALPLMNKNSSIILISSCAARMGAAAHSVYSSTKAAVSYLARSFAVELAPDIRVNAISPGIVDTPMLGEHRDANPELFGEIAKQIPQGRFANVDEIVEVVAFLGSSAGSYITGADLVADGGISSATRL